MNKHLFDASESATIRKLATEVLVAQAKLQGALELLARNHGATGEVVLLGDWSGITWLPENQQD